MKSSWNLACSLNVNCKLPPKLLILNQCFLPLHLNIGSSLLWWFRLNWNRSLSASILLVTKIHARCIYFICVKLLAFVSLIVLSSLWYLHVCKNTWLFQFDEKHIFWTLIENWSYKTQCQSCKRLAWLIFPFSWSNLIWSGLVCKKRLFYGFDHFDQWEGSLFKNRQTLTVIGKSWKLAPTKKSQAHSTWP